MWNALTQSAAVARRIHQAEQMIRGGVISDALVDFGDVMVRSAREHLVEAPHSRDPRRRVEDAAAALQDAYFAFERANSRGASVRIRRELARSSKRMFGQYRKGLGRMAGSAAGVAVLRASLGEPPTLLRTWLDRVAAPVALERIAGERYSDYYNAAPAGSPVWKVQRGGSGDADVRAHLISYFTLERLLLPADLVHPLPRAWQQKSDGAVAPLPAAELLQLYGSRTWPHYVGAGDEPGPNELLLMIPAEDVVPADPSLKAP
jgi:hypothetical protein